MTLVVGRDESSKIRVGQKPRSKKRKRDRLTTLMKALTSERKKSKRSVRSIAQAIGVSASMLSLLERGKRKTTYATVIRYIEELGLHEKSGRWHDIRKRLIWVMFS